MLRNVLEGYFDSITEREFDIPFMCLLLEEGFYDIHFLHGNYEFGKDFIAKKRVDGNCIQYVFQSKAGDINSAQWREIAFQCEEMRTNLLAHPNFDAKIEKETILVTTGRLIGGAALAAQQYAERRRGRGEIGLTIWDENTLIEKLVNCDVGLTGINGINTSFIAIITTIKHNKINFSTIEQYSRNWIDNNSTDHIKIFNKIILDAALIIHELTLIQKNFLACYCCLMAIRAIVYLIHKNKLDNKLETIEKCLNLIEDAYERLVYDIIEKILSSVDRNNGLLSGFKYDFGSIITYPITCSQLIENLGLCGLLQIKRKNIEKANEIAEIIVKIIDNNKASMNPISDKYATSLIAPLLLLYKFKYQDKCEMVLRNVSKWLSDRYEKSDAGLAYSNAKEEDEIATIMGYMFSFIDLPKRRESYLATIMLDLSAVLEFNNLYNDISNDFMAVGIYPCLIRNDNTIDQYFESENQYFHPHVSYINEIGKEGIQKVAFHHNEDEYFCEKNNLSWEALSIFSVVRNRHRIALIKAILSGK